MSLTNTTQSDLDESQEYHLKITEINGRELPEVDLKPSKKSLKNGPKSSKNGPKAKIEKDSISIKKANDNETREFNQRLTFEERLHIIHLHETHKYSIQSIAPLMGMKYSTVRAIVITY